jgi:hypothetical protein
MRRVVFIYKYFVPFLLFHKKTADRAFFDGIVRAFEIIGIGNAIDFLLRSSSPPKANIKYLAGGPVASGWHRRSATIA